MFVCERNFLCMYIQIKCRVVSQGLGNLVYMCIKTFHFPGLTLPPTSPFLWCMKSDIQLDFEANVVVSANSVEMVFKPASITW